MIKKSLFFASSIVLAGIIVGCSGESQSTESPAEAEVDAVETGAAETVMAVPNVVATVNGEEISKDMYTSYFDQLKMGYEAQGFNFAEGEEGAELLKVIEEQALDQLIAQTLLLQTAEEEGFLATDDVVEAQLTQIRAQFETEEELEEILVQEGLTIEELKKQIAQQITLDDYISEVTTTLSVTEEELNASYEELAEMYGDELPAFDEFKAELEQQILKEKANEQLGQKVESLKETSEIEVFL